MVSSLARYLLLSTPGPNCSICNVDVRSVCGTRETQQAPADARTPASRSSCCRGRNGVDAAAAMCARLLGCK
jgi:hypothetical protein